MALLCDAYREEQVAGGGEDGGTRVVLGLKPEFAPIKAAILPLSKKEPLQDLSRKIFDDLAVDFDVDYDESASTGKRYRRQDEIGTTLCITVDVQSLEDQQVTVRHCDKMTQYRVNVM